MINKKQLELLADSINNCAVDLIECNADYIQCNLCGATASYLYKDGYPVTQSSMYSIKHDDECAFTIINKVQDGS